MKEYQFIDKAVFIEKEKILVIADLHLGYEESLQKAGVFVPKHQYKETIQSLKKIFARVGKIKELIILGDLKHEFSGNSNQEWREVDGFLDFLKENCEKIVLVRGNHDNYLLNILKNKGIKLKDFYTTNNMAFIHGDKQFMEVLDKKIEFLFLGHLHPAISIRENVKEEKYKCFLAGKWKNKEIVILPSFFPLIEGVDVSKESLSEGNLAYNFDLRNFKVFIPTNDSVLEFGRVRDVGKLI